MDLNKKVEHEMLRQAKEALNYVRWRISMAGEEQDDGKPTADELTAMWSKARDAEQLIEAILTENADLYLLTLRQMTDKVATAYDRQAPI